MKKFISILIPVHNEESRIEKSISIVSTTLSEIGYKYEIIVIDDCSADDTMLILSRNKNITTFRKSVQQGKGAALKTGWKIATGDYVVFLDADLQINPREIKILFKTMDFYDADVVLANKRHPYSILEYDFFRNIVSNVYNLIVRILFGFPLRDSQTGFKLFKKEALDSVMNKVSIKKFSFDIELITALRENGFRIADAPVHIKKRDNHGSVSIRTILETFFETIHIWVKKQRGYYKNAK